jgi:VanZ family protein
MNYWQSSTNDAQQPTLLMAWLPVFFGLTVIFFESTRTMSGANTGKWLLDLCHALWGQVDEAPVDVANHILRKSGHFCGYGTLALFFRRAWYISLRKSWEGSRSRLPFSAAALAVFCVFCVASADEIHQSFLPGRTSSIYDVMLDTAGAILFNYLFFVITARRRRKLLEG